MDLSRLFCTLALLISAGSMSAATWDVAVTGCSDVTCNPCCTIQEAVTRSSGGDTINVGPGTYPEQIDIRGMLSVGDITIEAAGGPGTVLVSPAAGVVMTHTGSHTNSVTVDGLDLTSPDESGFFLAHEGDVVLRDINANNCGYTAFQIDATGSVTMERCTGNDSGRTGIQVDGAASTSLTDCAANLNSSFGIHVMNTSGTVDLINPTATGNSDEGIRLQNGGTNTITGATISDNGRKGIWAEISGAISVSGSTSTGNFEQGIDIGWDGADPVDSVTLTNVTTSSNGDGFGDSGVRLRDVNGPTVFTNCTSNDNGSSGGGDGFTLETNVVGNVEIYGGAANGNAEDGYDLRVTGNATVVGVTANSNVEDGVVTEITGTVFFQNSVANDNQNSSGFDIQWQDPDPIDAASVTACTANNNGLSGGGNGIRVKFVAGPVTVVGTETNGNSWTGVRVDDAGGSVLIRNAVSNFGLEEGFKIDTDIGPVTVVDCVAEGNTTEGLTVTRENVDVESLYVRRNTFVTNGGTGLALSDLSGSGLMSVQCNDIAGNNFGLYLDAPVTVDARKVWWGDASGPAGPGSGTGDGIFAEPGGTILYDPWLLQSISSPLTTCEMFGSAFESGLAEEWDTIVY